MNRSSALKYTRVTEDGFSKAKLIPYSDDLFELIKNKQDKPWFYSTFQYNEEHKKHFEEKHSVKGIRDVTTNELFWDFDAKDIDDARASTLELYDRLVDNGFNENNIQIIYSGNKGFHVKVKVDKELVPAQVEALAIKFAGDLQGFDTSMYDSNQLLRVPLTKHEKSGVYCIPITHGELSDLSLEELRELAEDVTQFDIDAFKEFYETAELDEEIVAEAQDEVTFDPKPIEEELTFDITEIDLKNKPKYLDEARWLLMNGFFKGSETADVGERNSAFLCLAATYKNLGYDKTVVYNMLQGVAELQAARTGETKFSDYELENNIIEQVFSDGWLGGQFTTRDPNNWLYKYAVNMGLDVKRQEQDILKIGDVKGQFINFVKNIEQNTIKIGIESLDKAIPITVGSNIGIVGSAGSGKTSLVLEILKNTSKAGVTTVFASLDMTRTRIYEKLAYKMSGMKREDLYEVVKGDEADDLFTGIERDYGNVWFYDRSSPSVDDIRNYILNVEKKTGEKVKLLVIDYFERVGSDISDDTASSKKVAGQLQDLLNDLDIAIITMCQPNKMSLGGGPDSEIKSYTAIKGSSFLYQSFRGIIGISRPFYTPKYKEYDKFMTMNILKNDLGELATLNYGWNGKRGDIYELEDIEHKELKDLLAMKKEDKDSEDDNNGWS